MNNHVGKRTGAILGAVALASVGAAGAAPLMAQAEAPAVDVVRPAETTHADSAAVARVQGSFAFDQATISSAESITTVFGKAAATLCGGLPSYGVNAVAHAIAVSGDVDAAFEATVSDMAADAETRELIMACACASNIAGGGAIANAEVSGVTLESLAAMAGAR